MDANSQGTCVVGRSWKDPSKRSASLRQLSHNVEDIAKGQGYAVVVRGNTANDALMKNFGSFFLSYYYVLWYICTR